jgi:SAM-dependent methyltransferase
VQQDGARRIESSDAAWFFAEYRARPQTALIQRLMERLELTPRDRVLDLDAGAGAVALSLAPNVGEVLAIDTRPDLLAEGARRAARAGIRNVTFIEGGPLELTSLALYGTFKAATLGMASRWLARPDDLLGGLAPVIDERGGALVFLGGDAGAPDIARAGEQLYGWRSRLAQLLEQFSPGLLASARADEGRSSLTERLAHSAFPRVERLRSECELLEQPGLEGAIGFLYSYPGVLERLGQRRVVFERVARDELGWVDRLPAVSVKRTDVAVLARRAD